MQSCYFTTKPWNIQFMLQNLLGYNSPRLTMCADDVVTSAGQGRAGQDRAGQGQGRAGQGRAGQGRAGQGRGGGRAGQGEGLCPSCMWRCTWRSSPIYEVHDHNSLEDSKSFISIAAMHTIVSRQIIFGWLPDRHYQGNSGEEVCVQHVQHVDEPVAERIFRKPTNLQQKPRWWPVRCIVHHPINKWVNKWYADFLYIGDFLWL